MRDDNLNFSFNEETHEFSIKRENIFNFATRMFRPFCCKLNRDVSQTKNKEKCGSCFTIVYRERDASLDLMNSLDADGKGEMEAI